MAGHGLVGPGLHARIDGGVDHQAVAVDVIAMAVGPVHQPAAQCPHKVRCRAFGDFLALEIQAQRAGLEPVELGFGQHLALDHLAQYGVAALHGALGVAHRVVVAGALEHAHQGGGFQHRELVGAFVEIGACRHLDAEGVVEKRDRIQIGLQDLVLGVERLDLVGGHGFLELAAERGVAPHFFRVEVARQLLGDGGAALAVPRQGVDDRGGGAAPVQPVVFVETVVFGGDQCLDHIGRNLGQRDPAAVAAGEQGQFLAVGAQDLGRVVFLGLADVRQAGREQHQHAQQQHQEHRHAGGGLPPLAAGTGGEKLAQGLPALAQQGLQLRDGSGERRWQGHGLRERPGGAACGALAHPTPASTGELTRSVCRSRAENTRGVGNCCLWRLGP